VITQADWASGQYVPTAPFDPAVTIRREAPEDGHDTQEGCLPWIVPGTGPR